jgi:hypothetical protein
MTGKSGRSKPLSKQSDKELKEKYDIDPGTKNTPMQFSPTTEQCNLDGCDEWHPIRGIGGGD